jgi:hypothetical protein
VIEQAQAAQKDARQHARRAGIAQQLAEDELVKSRAVTVERLRQIIARLDGRRIGHWPDELKTRAVALREVLQRQKTDVAACRSMEALDALFNGRVMPQVRQAEKLQEEAEAWTRAQEQLKRNAWEQQQRERETRQEQARQQRMDREAQERGLAEVVDECRQLERWWQRQGPPRAREGSPTQVLAQAGLLVYRPDEAPQHGRLKTVLGAVLGDPLAAGRWHTVDGRDVGPGTARECPALRVWGPGTREVLRGRLAALHADEDRWRAALGKRPRTGRPRV